MTALDPPARVMVSLDLRLGGERWHAEAAVPSGPAAPVDILPVLHVLADTIAGVAAREAEARGESITCRKGCGACCRQLVPISPSEAGAIRTLVERLPEERRTEIQARFQQLRSRLHAAGLLEKFLDPKRFSESDLQNLGLDYFRQGIACPFLEAEACSIHPERPLSCREYLVTSPAENCARPSPHVRRVPVPARISHSLLQLEAELGARYARWIPLSLALDGPEFDDGAVYTGPELLGELLRRTAAGPAPAPGDPHPPSELSLAPDNQKGDLQ